MRAFYVEVDSDENPLRKGGVSRLDQFRAILREGIRGSGASENLIPRGAALALSAEGEKNRGFSSAIRGGVSTEKRRRLIHRGQRPPEPETRSCARRGAEARSLGVAKITVGVGHAGGRKKTRGPWR